MQKDQFSNNNFAFKFPNSIWMFWSARILASLDDLDVRKEDKILSKSSRVSFGFSGSSTFKDRSCLDRFEFVKDRSRLEVSSWSDSILSRNSCGGKTRTSITFEFSIVWTDSTFGLFGSLHHSSLILSLRFAEMSELSFCFAELSDLSSCFDELSEFSLSRLSFWEKAGLSVDSSSEEKPAIKMSSFPIVARFVDVSEICFGARIGRNSESE